MVSECEKDPDAVFCQCDPPCGARCSIDGCSLPAAVLVPASQVFPEHFSMIIDGGGDGIDGMLTSADDWSALVCLVHGS